MLQWLRLGWILELREPTDLFWIGGAGSCPSVFVEAEAISAHLWCPDFFDLESTGPQASDWAVQISRDRLKQLLCETFKTLTGQDIARLANGQENLPRQLVHWKSPEKAAFLEATSLLQSEMQAGRLKKAVPVVAVEGVTAVNGENVFLIERLLHALVASRDTGLRVYGTWKPSGGLIGLTPEDLCGIRGRELTTMAVAGTAPISAEAASETVGQLGERLSNDPKEREEHSLVVDDLVARLRGFSGVSAVKVGQTEPVRFRKLLHLVTPLKATLESKPDEKFVPELIRHLHPTPALGLAPRSIALSRLKEIDDRLLRSSRNTFGAPFVVISKDRVEAVVAIRQVRWHHSNAAAMLNDRLELEILAGCGIVASSQPEKEWVELQAKRESVAEALGLSRETRRPLVFATRVVSELVARGVRHFVVCAGARNAPLVVTLSEWMKRHPGSLEVESFFDERSASFYALGVARSSGRPVAVVTTSGTAVTELHSALAEADLSGVPLIALTADRPKRLRHSGAPQSLNQNGIFAHFVAGELDIEEGDSISLPEKFSDRPWHLNVCFEEPLLSDSSELSAALDRVQAHIPRHSANLEVVDPSEEMSKRETSQRELLKQSLERRARFGGAAIVGRLSLEERPLVREFILQTGLPSLLEAPSGLRGDPSLAHLEIRSGDRGLRKKILAGELGQVFRLGGIPTTRVWRDLDDPQVACVTTSLSLSRFSGLGRGFHIQVRNVESMHALLRSIGASEVPSPHATAIEQALLSDDRSATTELERRLGDLPLSEPGWVFALSKETAQADLIYVGNSLPIRWWDWVATRQTRQAIEANRGVNGIDGQISTALGLMRGQLSGQPKKKEAWIFVGDLTALYDLSGPWALQSEELRRNWKLRLVVFNNSGGQIFREVLKTAPSGSAPFENAHRIGFEDWARMWGLSYQKIVTQQDLQSALQAMKDFCVLEVLPEESETAKFWKGLT